MKKNYSILRTLVLGIAMLSAAATFAQTYSLTATTRTYAAITPTAVIIGSTAAPPAIGMAGGVGNYDDFISNKISIGFNFTYGGVCYTKFRACSNGWIILDTNVTSTQFQGYDNTAGLATGAWRGVIAPLWDDIKVPPTVAEGSCSYQTHGTDSITIEWKNMYWNYSNTGGAAISFQARLYADGRIAFNYSQGSQAMTAASGGASIGLSFNAVNSFYSLNNSGAAPTASTVTHTNNITTKPATDQTYLWTPASGIPVNDDPCGAVTLTFNTSCPVAPVTGSTSNSTDSGIGGSTCTSGAVNDVWYKVTATATGNMIITTDYSTSLAACAAGTFEVNISVYNSTAGACGTVATGTYISCDDNSSVNYANNGVLTVAVTSGETYYIKVEGDANTLGNFSIACGTTAAMGNAAGADCGNTIITVPLLSGANYTYSTTGSTCCTNNDLTLTGTAWANTNGEDIIYMIRTTAGGAGVYNFCIKQTANFPGAGAQDNMAWYLTPSCPYAGALGASPGATPGTPPVMSGTLGAYHVPWPIGVPGNYKGVASGPVTLAASSTYYLVIDTRNPAVSCAAFSMDIRFVGAGNTTPAGNTCGDALAITAPYATTAHSTCCKGNDYGTICGINNYAAGEDMVFSIPLTSGTGYTVTVTNTNGTGIGDDNGWIAFFVSNTCAPTAASCVTSASSGAGSTALANFTAPTTATYYIIVDTWAYPSCANFNLTITTFTPPALQVCSTSDTLNLATLPYSNGGALRRNTNTSWVSPATTCGFYNTTPVANNYHNVRMLTGHATGTYYIKATNQTVSSSTTGSISWFVATACNNGPFGGGWTTVGNAVSATNSNVACGTAALVAGTNYWIYIALTASINPGADNLYNLEISASPVVLNDNPSGATVVSVPGFLPNQSTFCATGPSMPSSGTSVVIEPGSHTITGECSQANTAWTASIRPIWYKFTAPASGGVYILVDTVGITGARLETPSTSLYTSTLTPAVFGVSSMTWAAGAYTVTTAQTHNFTNGQTINISGSGFTTSNVPHGNHVVTVTSGTTFTIPWTAAAGGGAVGSNTKATNLIWTGCSTGNLCASSSSIENLAIYKNLTAGSTYYLRVAGNGTVTEGGFNLAIKDLAGMAASSDGLDCVAPITLCANTNSLPARAGNYGTFCDLQGMASSNLYQVASTTNSNEKGSIWLNFTIGTSCNNLRMDLTTGTTGAIAPRFMIFKYYGNSAQCDSLIRVNDPNTGNWSSSGTLNPRLYPSIKNSAGTDTVGNRTSTNTACTPTGQANQYFTGINSVKKSFVAACANDWLTDMKVVAGEQYLMVVYTGTSTNMPALTVDFSPSLCANIISDPPGSLTWTGLVSTNWFDAKNWSGGCAIPSCTVSASIPTTPQNPSNWPVISASGAATKDLIMSPGSSLTLNAGFNLQICGDFLNDGTFSQATTSSVSLTGTNAVQYLGSSSATGFSGANRFSHLKVNNTNPGAEIDFSAYPSTGKLEVRDSLSLLAGKLSFSDPAQVLSLGSFGVPGALVSDGVAAPNAYSTSYLSVGTLRRFPTTSVPQTLEFPVGNYDGLQRAIMTITSLGTSGPNQLDSIDVTFQSMADGATAGMPACFLPAVPTVYGVLNCGGSAANNNPGMDGIWKLTGSATSGTADPTYDLELYGKNFPSGTMGSSREIVKRANTTAGPTYSNWVNGGSTNVFGGAGTYTATGALTRVKNSGFVGFTEYGIGYSDVPLPLELTEFTGKNVAKNKNLLSWSTSSELNTDYFIVLRSDNGFDFSPIGSRKAVGTSQTASNYSLMDESPRNGKNYYRLQIFETSGRFIYSNDVLIDNTHEEFVLDRIYPNPAMSSVNFDMMAPQSGQIQIQVTSVLGKTMLLEKREVKSGKNTISTDVTNYSAGVYFVKVQYIDVNNESKVVTNRFVKL